MARESYRTADKARASATRSATSEEAWSDAPEGTHEVSSRLWSWVESQLARQRAHDLLDLIHEAIYEGRPMGQSVDDPVFEHLRRAKKAPAEFNVARSQVDTVTAKRCKRRPFPVLSADDASWSEKLYGKRVSRILRRKLGRSEVERMKPDVYRDAAIRGTGAVKVTRVGGDVGYERIPHHELIVDPREARYGMASLPQMAHVKPYSRRRLMMLYPAHVADLKAAPAHSSDRWEPSSYDAPMGPDRIDVVEAWYLPSTPDAEDGRHVITYRGAPKPLLDEEWCRPRFPIAWNYWSSPVRGVRGHGLVEDLAPVQSKINQILQDVQEAIYWGSAVKIFAARGSNISKAHLRARHPAVIEHDGAVPQFIAPNPVAQQAFQLLALLFDKSYELSGVAQSSAAARSSLGNQASGKALDTQYDIESERFAQVELGDAMFMCDLGQLTIDEAKAIAEDAKTKTSTAKGAPTKLGCKPSSWIDEVEWDRIDIDGGLYHLNIEPINFLPDSRAGKLSFVSEMAKAGLIQGKETLLSLFDEPDMARANRYILGAIRHIEAVIEGICDVRVPLSKLMADPHMKLDLALEMVTGELENARAEGMLDEKDGQKIEDRFLAVLSSIVGEQDKAKQASAPPPMLPPGPNAGGPGAPLPMDGGAMPLAPMPPPMATMPPTAPGMM